MTGLELDEQNQQAALQEHIRAFLHHTKISKPSCALFDCAKIAAVVSSIICFFAKYALSNEKLTSLIVPDASADDQVAHARERQARAQ